MGKLYHNITGDVVAVFEYGKVYKDIWKTQLVGTYKNEKIFVGKGMFKQHVGNYNGDIMIVRYGIAPILSKIGYVLGDDIYSGTDEKKSTKIAHFDSEDKFGAAAAALLIGMFSASREKNSVI